MLKGIHLKNWRSLRDVQIDDLTPITVFIGANSSGKSSILEALHYYRFSLRRSQAEALYHWTKDAPVMSVHATDAQLPSGILVFENHGMGWFILTSGGEVQRNESSEPLVFAGDKPTLEMQQEAQSQPGQTRQFARERWQLLLENLNPLEPTVSDISTSDLFTIMPQAQNMVPMLDFMRKTEPDLFAKLQEDLSWMLGHVRAVETEQRDGQTRVVIRENELGGRQAPTISGGTARVLAMLTALYALDMRDPQLPGLVAIEEPDAAIHPLLLSRLVAVMRDHVGDPERPRQFILTTHNPQFVNLFEPEEVRIVDRDESGVTTVSRVPEDITRIWRESFGENVVGDVWTTRSIGGVPR